VAHYLLIILSWKGKHFTRKEVVIMPRGDKIGPMGFGPRTGRSAGFCSGNPEVVSMNQMPGHGFGRRFGRRCGLEGGMGWGRWARRGGCLKQPSPEDERRVLEDHKEMLQRQLNAVNQKLEKFLAQEIPES
jgi:hypothetical protein